MTEHNTPAAELSSGHIGRCISFANPRNNGMTPTGHLEALSVMPNGKIQVVTRAEDGWKQTHFLPPTHPVELKD